MANSHSVAQDQIRAFVERIERMEEEKKAIAADIRDIYAEAKGNGFDVKVLRQVVKIRKQDSNERMEQEAVLDLYLSALGMTPLEQFALYNDPDRSAPKIGGFDDDQPDEPEFDEDAEQAAGAEVLENVGKVDPSVITSMNGVAPTGPFEAIKGGVRLWSDDGEVWRTAQETDVLPDGSEAVEFDPEEQLQLFEPEPEAAVDEPQTIPEGGAESSPAWENGYKARKDGADFDANPYTRAGQKADWSEGWSKADAEMPGDTVEVQPADDNEPATINADGFDDEPEVHPDLANSETISQVELTAGQKTTLNEEGEQARKDGFGPTRNPYGETQPQERAAWLAGYNREKARQAENDGGFAD